MGREFRFVPLSQPTKMPQIVSARCISSHSVRCQPEHRSVSKCLLGRHLARARARVFSKVTSASQPTDRSSSLEVSARGIQISLAAPICRGHFSSQTLSIQRPSHGHNLRFPQRSTSLSSTRGETASPFRAPSKVAPPIPFG